MSDMDTQAMKVDRLFSMPACQLESFAPVAKEHHLGIRPDPAAM